MEFEELILNISSRLDDVSGYKKSIIESDLNSLSGDIEEGIFKLRISEHNYQRQVFPKLKKQNIQTSEAIGLLFLSYLTYTLRTRFTYGAMWPIVAEDLMKYEILTTFFHDKYLLNRHPNPFLVTCIAKACERFNLRNSFDHQADEHYIRNTILLQMGILNRFTKLNEWLSYSSFNQTTLRVLLNKENDNFSNSFSQGWRILRRFRDHIIDNSTASSLLKQNVWFKELDIDDALRAAQKKVGTKFLAEDEIENVFFLDQILYEENVLKFVLNAEDLYALKLGGSDYSVYIDDEYAAKILRNDDKVLVLDKKIIVKEPDDFSVHLELKNEDGDVVYSDEVVLFDLHDQVLIFDDKGNIFKDFSKKLVGNRTYSMLFDSDLDSDVDESSQAEYFSGYVTLVSGLSKENNCILSYNGEELFSLNFTATVEKPSWIDHLVVYAVDDKLLLEEATKFHLKIFDIEDEDNPLKELPEEIRIARWTYADSYVDDENIENFVASIELSPELICERKHSFLLRYKGQTYHRTVHAVIYDHTNKYHLMQRLKDGSINLIEGKPVLNYDELVQSKFHLALFNFEKSKDSRILKDKMKYYGKVELNKKFQLTSFPKFGETIIASDHLYNDVGDVLFKVIKQGVIGSNNDNIVNLRSIPSYLNECEFIVLNRDYAISSLKLSDITIKNNKIELPDNYLSMVIVYEGNYIGSFVQYKKIDFNVLPDDVKILKYLYLAYAPLLIMEKDLLNDWIQNHLITFFKAFMADSFVTPNGQTIYFNFDEVNATIEHLLYDVEFYKDEAQALLQEIMLNSWAEKALKIPISLIYLLQLAEDKKFIAYFLSLLPDVEVPEDRDEQFIDSIVDSSLKHLRLDNVEKHNLKIAMHYKNKIFYLNESLNKLQESHK